MKTYQLKFAGGPLDGKLMPWPNQPPLTFKHVHEDRTHRLYLTAYRLVAKAPGVGFYRFLGRLDRHGNLEG